MENKKLKGIKTVKEKFDVKIFSGDVQEAMPQMKNEGYRSITLRELIESRFYGVQQLGKYNILIGESLMQHPDGRMKLVRNSKNISDIDQDTKLSWQPGISAYSPKLGLELPDGTFDSTEGYEISGRRPNLSLRSKNYLKSTVWGELFGDNMIDKYCLKLLGDGETTYHKNREYEFGTVHTLDSFPDSEVERAILVSSRDTGSQLWMDSILYTNGSNSLGYYAGVKED